VDAVASISMHIFMAYFVATDCDGGLQLSNNAVNHGSVQDVFGNAMIPTV